MVVLPGEGAVVGFVEGLAVLLVPLNSGQDHLRGGEIRGENTHRLASLARWCTVQSRKRRERENRLWDLFLSERGTKKVSVAVVNAAGQPVYATGK